MCSNTVLYTPLVKPIHGLISRGEAIRDKPAQYISMGARVSVRVVPNMEALPCLQIRAGGTLVVIKGDQTYLGARSTPVATDVTGYSRELASARSSHRMLCVKRK